jgi:hypothetical protein
MTDSLKEEAEHFDAQPPRFGSRLIYKPHSVVAGFWVYIRGLRPRTPQLSGHLSGLTISRQLGAANPELKRSEQLLVPAWPCSWRRLPGRGHCCPRRWSLTPPFHPFRLRGGMFLWPGRQVSPPRDFPRRHALWSADFPLLPATARLTWTAMIQCARFGVKCAVITWVEAETQLDITRPIAL